MSDPGPTSLTFEPLFAAAGAVAAVIYARAARRHHPGALRVASFTAGLLLIVVALDFPPGDAGRPLPAAGAPRPERVDRRLGAAAPPARAEPADVGGCLAALPTPLHGLANIGVALHRAGSAPGVLVHLAAFYDYALRHPGWLNLEHALLVFAGLVFWAPVVGAR